MQEWWEALTLFEQSMLGIAAPTTTIFLIQVVLTFMGIDKEVHDVDFDTGGDLDVDFDASADADFDAGGDADVDLHAESSDAGNFGLTRNNEKHKFQLITLRNIIVFLMMFGWGGFTGSIEGLGIPLSLVIGTVLGGGMMYVSAWMLKSLLGMTADGTMNIYRLLNEVGEVYIPIPAEKSGIGKVNIELQGSLRELEAMTKGERLVTGTRVRVTDILEDSILMVEPE